MDRSLAHAHPRTPLKHAARDLDKQNRHTTSFFIYGAGWPCELNTDTDTDTEPQEEKRTGVMDDDDTLYRRTDRDEHWAANSGCNKTDRGTMYYVTAKDFGRNTNTGTLTLK